MNNTLLPCPFCGDEAEIISRPVYTYLKPYDPETADKKHYVQCKGCATQCGALEYDTPEEAAAAWNRRSRPENKPLTLDELRQMDGEPVWVEHLKSSCSVGQPGEWLILKVCTPTRERPYIDFKDTALCALYYGKGWLAYRHKPERSEG